MKWLKSAVSPDSATILGLLSAVAAAFSAPAGIAIGALAVVVYVASLVKRSREGKKRSTAAKQARAQISIDRVLDATARSVGLGGTVGGWRISLYRLEVSTETWVLVGRASSNELFADKRDMPEFRHGQGVLRACLEGSERPAGRFDEMPALPVHTDPAWLDTLVAWGIPKGTARALRMKSRSYCGAVFKVGPQNGHQDSLGIIAESESPDGVNLRALELSLPRPYFESIAELVKSDQLLSAISEAQSH